MKLYGILCIAVAIVMLLAPMAAIPLGEKTKTDETETVPQAEETSDSEATFSQSDDSTISVFLTSENSVETMDMLDYIIGAVSAEMPASYNEEALKAQALAAVTYARYSKINGSDENIGNADISDDSNLHQGYLSESDMKEKWGEAYDSYYNKIKDAASEVIAKTITFDGQPIMAAYHAISSGKTESAENMWGKDVPYLVSTDSEWDKDSTRYSSEVIFSAEELKDLLKNTENTSFSADKSDWVKIKSTSPSGTVLEIELCGAEMTGMQARNILGLRSPVFDVSYDSGEFVFSVSGYGHGVGMSQNGANCMAQNGCSYKEIIAHYYPGTEII